MTKPGEQEGKEEELANDSSFGDMLHMHEFSLQGGRETCKVKLEKVEIRESIYIYIYLFFKQLITK